MTSRCLGALLLVASATSCGGPEGPPAVPGPTTALVPPGGGPARAIGERPIVPSALDIDPVAVALGGHDPREGVVSLCDNSLARARLILDDVRAMDTKPDADLSWDTTVGALDRAKIAIRNAGDFPGLMAVAHPDDTVREAAKGCEPKVDKLETELWLDAALARVVKRYAAKKEPLSTPRARLLTHTLRDFRRNGLELDAKGQERVRGLNDELTKLGQDFSENIAASHLFVDATPAQLEGVPKEWLAAHKPGADGKIRISTDYPDYFPVITYAKDRGVALELYKQFDNRAADKNIALLDRLLALRSEKAKLLGYATWSDYVLEPRMAKDSKTVATFLEGLRRQVAKKSDAEMAEFRALHVKLGGKEADAIPPSDRMYLEDQLRKSKYGLDSKEVSQYFEVRKVKEGLLAVTSKMFGIKFRPAEGMPTWHPDVEPMDVLDNDGKLLGRFYFDLYPREGKYKHAAVFSIRDTAKMTDGSRLVPIAAIECNFTKPGGAAPALMSHQDAVVFFHEFGHVIHHVLSESELSSFAGTSVARDFVESPSQMFEEWAWSKPVLDLFALHHETGKPIPDAMFSSMTRSRSFGRGLFTQRQLFLAALDQAYHTRPPPLDTTKVLQETNDAYTPFKYVDGTHVQASFGHLVGYDAGYYGYQWALSIAEDLFTRFKREGLLNVKTAADYRATILSKGGSEDETAMVTKFLGRAPSDAAYKAFLLE